MSRAHHVEPEVGTWYDSKNVPECFTVLEYEPGDYVQIQYLDGELDKIEFDNWDALRLQEIPEPEDATQGYSMSHEDEIQFLDEIESHEDLEAHLRHLDIDDYEWDDN